jgi:hypothetical protein
VSHRSHRSGGSTMCESLEIIGSMPVFLPNDRLAKIAGRPEGVAAAVPLAPGTCGW